jgi:hypothetical protein
VPFSTALCGFLLISMCVLFFSTFATTVSWLLKIVKKKKAETLKKITEKSFYSFNFPFYNLPPEPDEGKWVVEGRFETFFSRKC